MKLSAFFVFALVSLTLPAWAVPVTVAVVGPDHKPLANAQLSVLETPLDVAEEIKLQAREIPGEAGVFQFEREREFPVGKPDLSAPGALAKVAYPWARVTAPGMATETRLLRKADTTIHLQTGRVWGGVILDGDEKPVANATVEINSWSVGPAENFDRFNPDAPESAGFVGFGTAWKRQTTTDAEGRWQFDAMPARALASVSLNEPRYIHKSVDVRIGPLDAPPLFARDGATVTGVLVTPDGQPIQGARLSAGWDQSVAAKTGADGRFIFNGVEPGEVTLRDFTPYVSGNKADVGYIVPPLEHVSAIAGKTTDVGQWQAKTGVKVSGQIVDAATKTPLQGVDFYFWSGGGNIQSDAQGHIETRALPDNWNNDPFVGNLRKKDYISAQIPRPKRDKDAQTADLGTIEMARGMGLKGRVRVEGEAGKPSSLPSITLSNADGNAVFLNLSDGTGEFSSDAMKAGTYKVSLNFDMSGENKGWEIVSPATVKVPAPPKDGAAEPKAPPLKIVVKRLTDAPPLLGEISGRVTDSEGTGVGGALVSARLTSSNRSTVATAISENDGSFVLERLGYRGVDFAATRLDIIGIERPGYGWASQPTIETKAGATIVGNLTLKKLGVIFAGRVVNEAGQSAAGAWVGVIEARDFEPVQTQNDGSFELRDVPLDQFTLIAARGAAWTRVEANTKSSGIVLKLRTLATPDREAMADEALQGELPYVNLSRYWDILGVARLENLVARTDRYKTWFALELAKRNPQEFLRIAPALLENAPDNEARAALTRQLYLTRAASQSADDRAATETWLAQQKTVKRALHADSVRQLLDLAEIAAALKRPDEAASWLDYAAAIHAQLGGGAGGNLEMGGAAARLGYEAALPFAEAAKPAAEFDFWSGASATLAQNGDVTDAKRALARMKELAATPALIEADKGEPWNGPTRRLQQATQKVAVALADTDAQAALELLPTDGDDWERARPLLSIADRAIAANNAPAAERALRAILKIESGSDDDNALAASLAEQFDPQLGAQLWAEALQRTAPTKNDEFYAHDGSQASIGMWAFYHARLDAGRSRVLIEREWNWRLPAAVKDKDKEYSGEVQNLAKLEMGMAAVDPARALQMRAEASAQTGKDGVAAADPQLAAAIMGTDAQRARLGVSARN